MLRLTPSLLLLLSLLSAPLAAQASAEAVRADAALDRALETISADELRSDLYFLASDEMAGRDSPSVEQRIAARYIQARLQRLGFQPGAPGDSYLYEWSAPQVGLDKARTGLTMRTAEGTERELVWAEDYFLAPRSPGMREVSGEVLWWGVFDDAEVDAAQVRGKWLLGESDGGVPRGLQRALLAAGATGILVLPAQDAQQSVADALGSIAERYEKPRLSGRAQTSAGFPVVYLAEGPGAWMRSMLPVDGERGTALGVAADERCGYGPLDDAVLENVIGIWPGSDPELAKELIILSAHYDHVGVGNDGAIYNGADDNGSGTSGMLAIAEALTEYGPMRRSVMLMWVSAEEKGLLGSRAWTLDPYLPDGLVPLCNINIDMIGRNAPDSLGITPTRDHAAYSALTKAAEAHAAAEGFGPLKNADAYWSRSDHANFSRNLDIPVAFLFTDVHEDYHQPSDTPDKIDYDKMRRVCRLVMRMLHDLQIDQPEF